jgi:hypothetical protein
MTKYMQKQQLNDRYNTSSKERLEVHEKYLQDWLPQHISNSLQRKGDKVILTPSPNVVNAVLRFVPYSEVRRDVYHLANQPTGTILFVTSLALTLTYYSRTHAKHIQFNQSLTHSKLFKLKLTLSLTQLIN